MVTGTAGKLQDVSAKVQVVTKKLGVPALIIPYAGDADALAASVENGKTLSAFIAPFNEKQLQFTPLPFSHPLYILFSSGTTGVPKCIVHSAGGTLLQHLKEQRFHCGSERGREALLFHHLRLDDVELAGVRSRAGCHALPFRRLTLSSRMATCCSTMPVTRRFAIFGTSAKYIDAVRKGGFTPVSTP